MSTSFRTVPVSSFFFFFNDTATTEIYTLSLHDALPICKRPDALFGADADAALPTRMTRAAGCRVWDAAGREYVEDRKSTRLNSSHSQISYAVFCLKKKKKDQLLYPLEPRKQQLLPPADR